MDPNKRFELFLKEKEDLLKVYIEDCLFQFELSDAIEDFEFDPKKRMMKIPSSYFESDVDDDLVLWKIYMACALYPNYRKEPIAYGKRIATYQDLCLKLTNLLIEKVVHAGCKDDPAYQFDALYGYVQRRIRYFLYEIDSSLSKVILESKAMQYQSASLNQDIYDLLIEQGRFEKKEMEADQFALDLYQVSFDRTCLQEEAPIFKQDFASFYLDSLKVLVDEKANLKRLDDWIRAYLFPRYFTYFQEEIKRMEISSSTGEIPSDLEQAMQKNQPQQKEIQDQDGLIEEMGKLEKELQKQLKRSLQNPFPYEELGFSTKEYNLMSSYIDQTKKQREEMGRFWELLIGRLAQDTLQRVSHQKNGYLNMNTLIEQYPSFMEAQFKQNYKEIAIFDRFQYEKQQEQRPKQIDITFLIDNSGSMNHEKIDQARRAIAIVMLSLDDLQKRFDEEGIPTSVNYETYLYGTSFLKTKSFQDQTSIQHEKQIFDTMLQMKGNFGITDNGSVYQEILDSISPSYEMDLVEGNTYRFIFEITDGASSFPGVSKQYVEKLLKKKVYLYAIEIGQKDDHAKKVFSYIYNEGYEKPHGIYLEDKYEKLPYSLCECLKEALLETI